MSFDALKRDVQYYFLYHLINHPISCCNCPKCVKPLSVGPVTSSTLSFSQSLTIVPLHCTQYCNKPVSFAFVSSVKKDFELARRIGGIGRQW